MAENQPAISIDANKKDRSAVSRTPAASGASKATGKKRGRAIS